jgi:hypothetical protein
MAGHPGFTLKVPPVAIGLLLGLLIEHADAQAPLQRTMSESGQFAMYGATAPRRLAVARRAEELRGAWLGETGLGAEGKWPIVIDLAAPSATRSQSPSTALFLGDGDLLKVQVSVPATSSPSDLDVAILKALGIESIYREARPKDGKPYSSPPAWLVEGVYQGVVAREEGTTPALFAKLVETGPPPKLDAFLRERPEVLNPTSRAIYRAHAFGLLNALEQTSEGRSGLAKLLASLHNARPEDPATILNAFPSLAKDPAQLVKLWTLSMARASASDRVEPLTAAETDRRLTALLESIAAPSDMKLGEGEASRGVAAMPALAKHASGRYVLERTAEDLLRIEVRAHPLYKPVVSEYRSMASQLSVKPRRDAAKRLGAAAELQAALRTRMDAITDELNLFEASRLDTPSEAFEGALPDPSEPVAPPRNDPISVAVDAASRATR